MHLQHMYMCYVRREAVMRCSTTKHCRQMQLAMLCACANPHVQILVYTACDKHQYLEISNLSIKMPFKLHGQLAQLIYSESGSMYAGGKQVLTIRRRFHAVACSWKLQILHQLHLPPAECKKAVSDVFIHASDKQLLAMQRNLNLYQVSLRNVN